MDDLPATDYLKEWRVANRAASAAEREILACSMASIDGRGAPPQADALLDARRKRELANDLFKVAMQAMQEQARRLKP